MPAQATLLKVLFLITMVNLILVNSQRFLSKDFREEERKDRVSYSEKVIKAGFEFEEHKIVTEDGYILTAWRIPRRLGEEVTIRPPVLLQHGLLDDSWTWFALKNTTDCLPIMLAEENYDVWITNSRGNMFSSEHMNPEYDPNLFKSEFWNFTWHEMAQFDLKANIEYIKTKTENKFKIRYVGHSQGTFQFFIGYLINSDYLQDNILKFVSIGTVPTIFYSVSYYDFINIFSTFNAIKLNSINE